MNEPNKLTYMRIHESKLWGGQLLVMTHAWMMDLTQRKQNSYKKGEIVPNTFVTYDSVENNATNITFLILNGNIMPMYVFYVLGLLLNM